MELADCRRVPTYSFAWNVWDPNSIRYDLAKVRGEIGPVCCGEKLGLIGLLQASVVEARGSSIPVLHQNLLGRKDPTRPTSSWSLYSRWANGR